MNIFEEWRRDFKVFLDGYIRYLFKKKDGIFFNYCLYLYLGEERLFLKFFWLVYFWVLFEFIYYELGYVNRYIFFLV